LELALNIVLSLVLVQARCRGAEYIYGFIIVPIITIMILFYVGIRLRIFPLAVKIVLMVAPTFWIIFMIFLCLYCRNQTEYQRKQKIVEDENNIILDTNN